MNNTCLLSESKDYVKPEPCRYIIHRDLMDFSIESFDFPMTEVVINKEEADETVALHYKRPGIDGGQNAVELGLQV